MAHPAPSKPMSRIRPSPTFLNLAAWRGDGRMVQGLATPVHRAEQPFRSQGANFPTLTGICLMKGAHEDSLSSIQTRQNPLTTLGSIGVEYEAVPILPEPPVRRPYLDEAAAPRAKATCPHLASAFGRLTHDSHRLPDLSKPYQVVGREAKGRVQLPELRAALPGTKRSLRGNRDGCRFFVGTPKPVCGSSRTMVIHQGRQDQDRADLYCETPRHRPVRGAGPDRHGVA
jgi:hypothetical protein